jgi:hypothetical protein
LHDLTADALACPGGMNEECADFCWVKVWVEELILFKFLAQKALFYYGTGLALSLFKDGFE